MQISKFKSAFTNFQRPNLYRVDFAFKSFQPSVNVKLEAVSLLCKEAAFPFFTFNLAESFYNGYKHSTVQQIDYDPVNLTFMIDTNGSVLTFLREWSYAIKDEFHNFGFRDDYVADITINMLDQRTSEFVHSLDKVDKSILNNLNSNEIITAKVVLRNAFPVNIDSIPLSYESNDEISTVSVALNFDFADYGITSKSKSVSSISNFLNYAKVGLDVLKGTTDFKIPNPF